MPSFIRSKFIGSPFTHGGGGALAGGVQGALTFHEEVFTGTNATTFTFNSVNIGPADLTRRVIVSIATRHSAERTLNSATIDGGAAVLHVNINSGSTSQDSDLAIASRLVPTGETTTITVTMSGETDVCTVGVWTLTHETSASPFATASDNTLSGDALSATIDIPETGALIVATCCVGGPDVLTAWTGATERFDVWRDFVLHHSGGDESGLPAEVARALQASFAATPTADTSLLAAVSWAYE